MIGPISSSVRSEPSESTSSSIAGSVLTIGIGRPAPSSERARNRSVSAGARSEEHTSELQSPCNLVCRLLLEKKKKKEEMGSGKDRITYTSWIKDGLYGIWMRT